MRITRLALASLGFVAAVHSAEAQSSAAAAPREPNEMGRIPVLEYHLIGEREGRWARSWERFARDLELLHARGYRPITVRQLVSGDIDLPAGLSPVVITFDDASPGQFRYIEENGQLRVDPRSAVGIWDAFAARHPEWKGRGVFCVLTAASEGHALFGERNIQGQRSEWRHRKLRYLIEQGHEVCNHTLYHVNLARASSAFAQEQIARAQLAVDSAVSGYRMRTFALPLGEWPEDRSLLRSGRWPDPRTGRVVTYEMDAVLMVAGGPSRSPKDPQFDPMRIPRVQVFGEELERVLEQLDRPGARYVSAGRRPVGGSR
ncbi:MAG: polysaccharide deacetylase family protein [Gemmatimonadaceae bacterium]|nr:polysaccharide deacetylase family protein [Gemmatimonadaceae bacterium]MCW5827167.1 polysaccharide deacetylase family protein [Gemmatimonadaceae bacterium]